MTYKSPKEYSLHVVGLLLHTAAQIVLTPPAPRNGGPFLPFFGQAGDVETNPGPKHTSLDLRYLPQRN